jgi:hypothetical protein
VLLGDEEAATVSRVGNFMISLMTEAFVLPGPVSQESIELTEEPCEWYELITRIEGRLHEGAFDSDEDVDNAESIDPRTVLVCRCWEGRPGNAT